MRNRLVNFSLRSHLYVCVFLLMTMAVASTALAQDRSATRVVDDPVPSETKGDAKDKADFPKAPAKEKKDAPEAKAAELPLLFHHDFRTQTIPDELTKFQIEADVRLQPEPEGLRITIPKTAKHPFGGVGLVTAFGLKGDFEVTTSFEILAADEPPPKGYGAGFSLYAEKADGVAAILGRLHKPGDKQVLMFVAESFGGGEVPCSATLLRTRLRRIGDKIGYYWAPGLTGDNFIKIKQVSFDGTAVKRIKLVALNGRTFSNVDVRVFDISIRGMKESNPTAAVQLRKVASKESNNNPGNAGVGMGPGSGGGLAAALIVGLLITLAAAGGVWFYVRRRRRSDVAPAAETEPVAAASPEAVPAPIFFNCSNCAKKLKVKAELAGRKIKCPQCATAVSVPG